MASRATQQRWLTELTNLPTAPGREGAVVDWISRWAERRPDLELVIDSGGNLVITQRGRNSKPPVLAVAHMDHPAFVVEKGNGRMVEYQFRGSVDAPYFVDAPVEIFTSQGVARGRVAAHHEPDRTGVIQLDGAGPVAPGDIGRWVFPARRIPRGRFAAPACDDLAGVAVGLAALDRARAEPAVKRLGVLLTRAEEVGMVGAIHAATSGSLPSGTRLLSIETSRELPHASMGDGPIIRVGDATTVFDPEMTNRISHAARRQGLQHQRCLMSGGTCEATAFGVFGYPATGLCLALGNWHNRGNLVEVEAGRGRAIPMKEEISLNDFHGLIDLLLLAARAVDEPDGLESRYQDLYQARRSILG